MRCEALEIVGRAAGLHDVAAAQRAFEEALTVAGRHGLAVWRARALHELGTIDLLDSMRTDRLEAARRAAIETGVPATVAVADFHLGEALVARGHAAAGRAAAERAAAVAYRLGSSVRAPALLTVARSYAHQRRPAQMEQALARAAEAAPGDVAIEAGQWGRVRAMLALHNGDADGARAALDRAVGLLHAVPGHHFPHWGLWALLHSADIDGKGPAARSAAAGADGSGTRFNRALLRAAHAVAERSADGVAEATTDLRGYVDSDWLVHLMRWLIAPAAIRDGWGEPVSWLQAAVRWFADHGYAPLATSCRTVLRDAGGPIPRRAPGGAPVPDHLRSRGVSSREADVLRLLGVRMSNREIAAELVLSPRTVEKHVASLLRKTGAPDRVALAALAATLPPGRTGRAGGRWRSRPSWC